MNKKTLKYIKNDMWEVLYNKKYVQAGLKAEQEFWLDTQNPKTSCLEPYHP